MTRRFDAPFVEWAQTRATARLDLAGSAVISPAARDAYGAGDLLDATEPGSTPPLAHAIAARYGVSTHTVTTAHGATGANFIVCAALLEPGDDVLIEQPGYDGFFGAPRLVGAHTTVFARDFGAGFQLDPAAVRRAVTPRTRLIVISNPHNPTGVMASVDTLAEIGAIAEEHDARVLVDEVYIEIAAASANLPYVPQTAAKLGDVFITTNSLSKSFGLAGLRCGWVLSSSAVAERLRAARNIVNGGASAVADGLAALAFRHIDSLLVRSRTLVDANGQVVRGFLASRSDLEWIDPPGGTLVFPRLRGIADSESFVRRLLTDYGTAVVPGHFFGAPAHFRLGFGCDRRTLEEGLGAIASALDAGVRDG